METISSRKQHNKLSILLFVSFSCLFDIVELKENLVFSLYIDKYKNVDTNKARCFSAQLRSDFA